MPIYEFECVTCDHRFERLQKLSDADPSVCPDCGKPNVKRRLTAPAFRLSGSGWYETDFKKEGDTRRNLASKDEGPSATASSTSAASTSTEAPKAEAKPASTPATND